MPTPETMTQTQPQTAADETDATTAATEPADERFAITGFEITGNLLLPVETIEQALQRYVGENRSRDDLFSIRHTVIKLYRGRDLDGVAVAVPTPGEAGLLEVKIFEDDIDVYPQQAAKAESAAQPEVVADSSPATPAAEPAAASSKQPRTYAIKLDPVEKPAVIVIPAPRLIESEVEAVASEEAMEESFPVEDTAAKADKSPKAEVVADATQGSFNISGFEIYGNSLVTTAAIRELLKPHLGAGKSYADLVDAKQQISQLYRDKGHKMVAIGMPARIFGEAIPVRIYEAKRSRATDLSMN